MSEGASWKDLIVAVVLVVPLLGVMVYVMKHKYKISSVDKLVMAECKSLLGLHASEMAQHVNPVVMKIGHSGPRGSAVETQVTWINKKQGVNVVCIGHQRGPLAPVKIRRFAVDGKSVNVLSKREER